jgi:serine/threonine protein kinase
MLEKCERQDFKFVERAGGGGQAVVEIWMLKTSGEKYAIKIYTSPSADMCVRLGQEAEMLMRLKYPSIVRGHIFFLPTEVDRSAWIVMENMSGGSLSEAIQKKLLDATKVNCLIISLVKYVLHLHYQGILHRDINKAEQRAIRR